MATDVPSVSCWRSKGLPAELQAVCDLPLNSSEPLPVCSFHCSCNFLGTQPGGLVLPRKASQCPGGKPDPSGCVYQHWGCFVLEAQHYPDAVHNPAFPPIVLRAGEVYRQHTRYAFPTV